MDHRNTGQVTHSFLMVPECPYPLLGRDLLSKVGAQIHFSENGVSVTDNTGQALQILTLRLEDEHRLFELPPPPELPIDDKWLRDFPQAWAETAGMGLASNQPPLIIELKPTATPVSIRQYPMSREAQEGIRPHIQRLLKLGILKACHSPWNTPLLPAKKPGTGDYRPVQDLREVNRRTLDIHPTVQNPYNLLSTLPPTHVWYSVLDLKDAFFCLRLSPQSQPLFAFEWKDPDSGVSGQLTWTRLPQGFSQVQVAYLGYLLEDGQRWLTDSRKQAVAQIPPPKGAREVREFLGTAGFCRLWKIKRALLSAPALTRG